MAKLGTRAQISEAIGAAKELIEACNRATCELLQVSYSDSDFPKLGKTVRKRLAELERGSGTATRAIDQLFAGMATIELALATLRNEVGTGHGRSALPKGLRPRHGQLAIDTADTHARYLVSTLSDLNLI
nr:abortive infection family protein [Nocardioides sp. zg-DK7169]